MSVHSEFKEWLDRTIEVSENFSATSPVGTPLYERDHQKRRAEILNEVRVVYKVICERYGV